MEQISVPKNCSIDIFVVIIWAWVRYLYIKTAEQYPGNKYSLKRIDVLSLAKLRLHQFWKNCCKKNNADVWKHFKQVTLIWNFSKKKV